MVGDLLAGTDPDVVMLLDMVEEILQRFKFPRPAQQAAVHADRHHFRLGFTLLIEHVKGVAQVGEELLGGIEALRRGEAHIVALQRVGDHQMRLHGAVLTGDLHPERQIVAVVVAVVAKAALLHHQPPRVGAVAAGVPAGGRFAEQIGQHVDRLLHMLPFGFGVHRLIVDPAPAVAYHVVVGLFDRLDDLRMTRQRHRDAEHRQRQAALLEFAVDAPEAGARTIFVERIHRHMAIGIAGRPDDVGEELLGSGIAVQHVVLCALFIVEHELYRHACLVRPGGVRRRGAIADQIARIVFVEAVLFLLCTIHSSIPV